MKKRLHEHLRACLADSSTEDLLEPLPADYDDPTARAEKRQRVEKIAADYLQRGRPPVFLSTRLRGPFGAGWPNPWATTAIEQETPESCGSPIVMRSECAIRRTSRKGKGGGAARVAVMERGDDEANAHNPRGKRSSTRTTRPKTGAKSQKGERGIYERHGPSVADDPASEGEYSVSAGHFSGQTDRITSNSPANARWLKRRKQDSGEGGYMENAPYGSPTRSRGDGETNTLPRTNAIARSPSSYPKAPELEIQIQSSAPAPMAISSPVQRTPSTNEGAMNGMWGSDTMGPLTVPDFPLQPGSTGQTGRTPIGAPPSLNAQTPGTHFESNVLRLYEESHTEVHSVRQSASFSGEGIPYREEIQRSAERCVDLSKPSSKKRRKSTGQKKPKAVHNESPGVDHPPQPAPVPFSSSFTYRKVGTRKTGRGGRKPAPQPMNFDSPPAIARDGQGDSAQKEREADKPADLQSPRKNGLGMVHCGTQTHSPRSGAHTAVDEEDEEDEEAVMVEGPRGEERRESGSSRQSLYSTQAAMMLAHLEFQDGTFPSSYASSGSKTPRPTMNFEEDRLLNDTPKSTIPQQPSPAITPFHAFNAELDKRHADTGRSAVPVSTQDLFMAASPFAFSTVKKTKSTAPVKGSGLRFAVLSYIEGRHDGANGEDGRSPTPSAERVPLKTRNSLMSFKSPYEKELQTQRSAWSSQESTFQFGQKDVTELPQLSFAGSLDGELNFADQFLQNLGGLT